METTAASHDKISEALKLLEEAARDKKAELQNILKGKYNYLKEALGEKEHDVMQTLSAAKKRAMEAAIYAKEVGGDKAKVIASEVDQQVREHPWPYIGGVAIGALLIGYILGRNK